MPTGWGLKVGGWASEAYFRVRVLRYVDAVDEPDLMRLVLHDHGTGPDAVSEESHAAHQRPVGDAGRGEDDRLPGRQILRPVHLLEIGDAHRTAALFVFRLADHQAREDLAVQAAHR